MGGMRVGYVLTCLIKLGWKDFADTDALAYWSIKLNTICNKLECFGVCVPRPYFFIGSGGWSWGGVVGVAYVLTCLIKIGWKIFQMQTSTTAMTTTTTTTFFRAVGHHLDPESWILNTSAKHSPKSPTCKTSTSTSTSKTTSTLKRRQTNVTPWCSSRSKNDAQSKFRRR